jgi:hypothetical protein
VLHQLGVLLQSFPPVGRAVGDCQLQRL